MNLKIAPGDRVRHGGTKQWGIELMVQRIVRHPGDLDGEGQWEARRIDRHEPADRAALWRHIGEVGASSLTIWSVLTGTPIDDPSPPFDPDDFRRCHELLEWVPEWRERLSEVATAYPEWKGLVEHWGELTAMLVEDGPTGESLRMYELMESLLADNAPGGEEPTP